MTFFGNRFEVDAFSTLSWGAQPPLGGAGGGGGGGAGYFLGDLARPRRSLSISSSSDEDKHLGDDLLGEDDTPDEEAEAELEAALFRAPPDLTARVLWRSLVYLRAFLVAWAIR